MNKPERKRKLSSRQRGICLGTTVAIITAVALCLIGTDKEAPSPEEASETSSTTSSSVTPDLEFGKLPLASSSTTPSSSHIAESKTKTAELEEALAKLGAAPKRLEVCQEEGCEYKGETRLIVRLSNQTGFTLSGMELAADIRARSDYDLMRVGLLAEPGMMLKAGETGEYGFHFDIDKNKQAQDVLGAMPPKLEDTNGKCLFLKLNGFFTLVVDGQEIEVDPDNGLYFKKGLDSAQELSEDVASEVLESTETGLAGKDAVQ